MSITTVEIESIHGAGDNRMVYYRAQDSDGVWHGYGPVITSDPAFDATAFKSVVAEKMAESLAASEFDALLGGA